MDILNGMLQRDKDDFSRICNRFVREIRQLSQITIL